LISGELLAAPGRRQGYDEVHKESAMSRAWSTGLGVMSCDVCTRTEEFWAPAAMLSTKSVDLLQEEVRGWSEKMRNREGR
jgi:hypothetical protein